LFYVAVWRWAQRLPGFRNLYAYRCRVLLFLVDEAAGWLYGWPSNPSAGGLQLSWNNLQAENFLKTLVRLYASIQYGILMHVKVLDLHYRYNGPLQ
jgi:hypothetical protein